MREHHRISPRPVPPEFRLKPLLWAAPAFAFSFFWLGWTSYPSISIVRRSLSPSHACRLTESEQASPILSLVLLAASILLIFLSCFNYLVSAEFSCGVEQRLIPRADRHISGERGERALHQHRRAIHLGSRVPSLRSAE